MVCYFFSTSVANETEDLSIWFKLNQCAKIPLLTKWKYPYLVLALKESEKKVYESIYDRTHRALNVSTPYKSLVHCTSIPDT